MDALVDAVALALGQRGAQDAAALQHATHQRDIVEHPIHRAQRQARANDRLVPCSRKRVNVLREGKGKEGKLATDELEGLLAEAVSYPAAVPS